MREVRIHGLVAQQERRVANSRRTRTAPSFSWRLASSSRRTGASLPIPSISMSITLPSRPPYRPNDRLPTPWSSTRHEHSGPKDLDEGISVGPWSLVRCPRAAQGNDNRAESASPYRCASPFLSRAFLHRSHTSPPASGCVRLALPPRRVSCQHGNGASGRHAQRTATIAWRALLKWGGHDLPETSVHLLFFALRLPLSHTFLQLLRTIYEYGLALWRRSSGSSRVSVRLELGVSARHLARRASVSPAILTVPVLPIPPSLSPIVRVHGPPHAMAADASVMRRVADVVPYPTRFMLLEESLWVRRASRVTLLRWRGEGYESDTQGGHSETQA